MKPNKFGTLVEAENNLRKRGYDCDFQVNEDGRLHCTGNSKDYRPEDVTIVEHHRFEGASNPGDMAVLYAIEVQDDEMVKGVLIDAYGTYSAKEVAEFIRKVEDIKQQGDKENYGKSKQ